MNVPAKKTIAAAAAAAAVTAGGLAVGSANSAEPPGARTITARLKVASVTFVHRKRTTKGGALAPGDQVLTRQKIFSTAGKRMGTLNTDCVNVGKKAPVFVKAVLQCNATYTFADGQITAVGTLQGAKPAVPIVGGTGSYRGARGVAHAGPPAKGYESVDLLELDN